MEDINPLKEEIRRIMTLVQEGKLSPEDAAELIDAFTASETSEYDAPPPPPEDADGPTGPAAGHPNGKDPLKSFVDFMEGIGKEVSQSVDWQNVAKQVRAGTQKGFEHLKTGVDQIRQGKVNWSWFAAYETRDVTLPLSVGKGKTLRIENPVGDVKVLGGQPHGAVTATARIRGMDADEAHEKAESYTIIIEESDHQVLIRQPDVSGLSVDLEVSLDTACAVEVRTSSGNTKIEGTAAGARVDTQSGNVTLRGLDGPIEVHSQSGNLELADSATSSATVEIKSGNIALSGVTGNVAARSASGNIAMKRGAGRSISVESVTGDVAVDLREPVSGTVNIRTVNGNAEVAVADGSDCRVSLSTLKGHVVCDLVLDDEAKQEQHVTGRLGEGNGTLDVSAVNGNIAMKLRAQEVSA